MIRSVLKGVLLLGVVGLGYWYLSDDGAEDSGSLLHTPRTSQASQTKGSRVAKAKASMKSRAWGRASAKDPEKGAPKGSGNRPEQPKTKKAAPAKAAQQKLAKNKASEGKGKDKGKSSSNKPFEKLKASALAKTKKPANASSSQPSAVAKAGKMERVSTSVPGLTLARVALANEVDKREPVQLAERFANGSRVHLFMEAKNLSEKELTLVVQWHDPALAHPVSVPLKVPANKARYRTWANSSPIKRAGPHQVSVQVQGGPEIYRRSFTVLAAELPAGQKLNQGTVR